jgi:hypothetical protein
MPIRAVLDLGEAAALDGLGQDHRRLPFCGELGLSHDVLDRGKVAALDGEHPRAESRGAATVGVKIPAQLCRAALPRRLTSMMAIRLDSR